MDIEERFIGRGWAFPPAFTVSGSGDAARGEVATSTGIEDIRQALGIICRTALGERLMRPEFGCGLEERVFDAMNASMLSYVETLIRTAILFHEPRIDADQIAVAADQAEGRLDIRIGFVVRGSNSRFNMVLPFYLTRG